MDPELLEATGAACTCRDCRTVVSPAAYLADLLDYVVRHVRRVEDGTEEHLSLDGLVDLFHQPFDAMPATACEATEDVERQVRLCIEVLRRELDRPLPDADAEERLDAAEAEYRQAAYEALLEGVGTSVHELRTARADAEERESLADRLGIAQAHLYGDYPDPYDDEPRLYLDRDEVTEDRLADLFGLANTNPPPEGIPEDVDTPRYEAWRLDHLRGIWTERDFPTDAYSPAVPREERRPVVDPDVVGPDDFRDPDGDPAFDLWETRREWVDGQLEELEGLTVAGDDGPVPDIDAMFDRMYGDVEYGGVTASPWDGGPPPTEFESTYLALTEGEDADRIEDARRAVERLHLTVEEFTRLVEVQRTEARHSRDPRADAVADEEWRDVYGILVQAQKRALYPDWVDEEASEGVLLGPKSFWVSLREPATGRWPPERSADRPLVDPERVERDDLPGPTAGSDAVELREDRQTVLDDRRDAIEAARERDGFDAMLTAAYGRPPAPAGWDDVDAWDHPDEWGEYLDARRDQVESDDPAEVERALEDVERHLELTSEDDLDLTRAEFTHLLEMRLRADPGSETEPPTETEWETLYATLTSNWKRKEKYAGWREHERDTYPYWRLLEARLPPWRASHEVRDEWQQALRNRSRPPVVDPDLVDASEFANPVPDDDAYSLRTERLSWLATNRLVIEEIGAGSDDRDRLDAKLDDVVGVSLAEFEEIADRRDGGDEFAGRLDQLDLTSRAYTYLRRMVDLVDAGAGVSAEQWRNVDAILLQVAKRRQFGEWRREERDYDPTLLRPAVFELEPDVTVVPEEEDDPARWRVDRDHRREWTDTLEARTEQRDGVEEATDDLVGDVEEETLPQLRDALVVATTPPDRVFVAGDPESELAAKADWVTDRFLVDAKTDGCQETTRMAQAIETLQAFVFAIRTGQEDLATGEDVSFVIHDEEFDERWEWLGAYASWKAARALYLYPENVLLPSLRDEQTAAFDDIVESLGGRRQLSPEEADEFAEEYSEYYRDVCSLAPGATCWASPGAADGDDGEPARRLHMFARGGELEYTGEPLTPYWSAYDPASEEQTFWRRVPGLENVVKVLGAVPFRGFVYVFVKQAVADDEELAYVRFDLETESWEQVETLDFPGEGRVSAAVVQRSSETRPPQLVIYSRETGADARPRSDEDRIAGNLHVGTLDPDNGGWTIEKPPVRHSIGNEVLAAVEADEPIETGDFEPTTGVFMVVRVSEDDLEERVRYLDARSDEMSRRARDVLNEVRSFWGPELEDASESEVLTAMETGRLPSSDEDERIGRLIRDAFRFWGAVSRAAYYDRLKAAFSGLDAGSLAVEFISEPASEGEKRRDFETVPLPLTEGDWQGALFRDGVDAIYALWGEYQDRVTVDDESHDLEVRWDGRSPWGGRSTRDVFPHGSPWGSIEGLSTVDVRALAGFSGSVLSDISFDYPGPFHLGGASIDRVAVHNGVSPEAGDSSTSSVLVRDTGAYDGRIEPVSIRSLSRGDSTLHAEALSLEPESEVVAPLVEFRPETFDIPGDLTAEQRATRRDRTESIYRRNEARAPRNLAYVAEAHYFVPVLLALRLQRSGEYVAALDWFRTVYDYSTGEEPKIYYGLEAEESFSTALDRGEDWLLDPLDVHAIASTRKEAYTRFTLYSIVRCLVEYAGQEFARDTKSSLARARTLYRTALDLLEVLESEGITDPCDDLDVSVATGVRPSFEGTFGGAFDGSGAIDQPLDEPVITIGDREVTGRDLGIDLDLLGGEDEAEAFERVVGEVGPSLRALGERIDRIEGFSERREAVGALEAALTDDGDTPLSDRVERAFEVTAAVEQDGEPATYGEVLGGDSATESYAALLADDSVARQVVAAGEVAARRFDRRTDAAASEPDLPLAGGNEEPVADGGEVSGVEVGSTLWRALHSTDEDPGMGGSSPTYATSLYQFCVPSNPLLDALRLRARTNLYKLRNCLNIAGMRRRVEPYAAPIDVESSLPTLEDGQLTLPQSVTNDPTPYRYQTLIDRAKELVDRAQQLESQLLSALEARDREAYKRLQARQDKKLARAGVRLQSLRVREAEERVELAELQRERARVRVEHYAELLAEGLLEEEKQALRLMRTSAGLHAAAAAIHASVAASSAFGEVASKATGGLLGSGALPHLARSLSETAAATSTTASVLQTSASYERRRQRWELQESLARKDASIGRQQVDVAESHVDVVEQERAMAETRYDHAEDVVEFLEKTQETTVELYDWMSNVLEDVYRYFLQQATAMARLAESQLAFERQEVPPTFVQADYWEPPTRGQSTDPDDEATERHGLTGSARLLRDIFKLDQYAFETDERKHQLTKTISLAREYPYAFERFRETGVLTFDTPMELFDRDFPGHYLRLIKRVRTSVLALVPPTEGIKATLSTTGISRVVTGGELFQTRVVRRDPESVALTSPQDATGLFELQPRSEPEKRLPFESMGVDTRWEFEMPKAANQFDYDTIADVLLTIEYTALEDYSHRQQVIDDLDAERSADRAFSFREEFADQWFDLNNADPDADTISVSFSTRREDFLPNVENLTAEHLLVYFVGAEDGETAEKASRMDVELSFAGEDTAGTVSAASSPVEGVVSTRSVSGGSWISLTENEPVGEWELSLPNTPQVRSLFEDEEIEDILFVVTYEGRTPEWPE